MFPNIWVREGISTTLLVNKKERAKWNLDRDHLVSLRTDLSDQLEKVDVKKDFLMRENEKLKNEHKASRRSGASANNIS